MTMHGPSVQGWIPGYPHDYRNKPCVAVATGWEYRWVNEACQFTHCVVCENRLADLTRE